MVYTRTVEIEETVPPATGYKLRETSPLTGKITQLMFIFPSGPSGLLRVSFSKNNVQIVPQEGMIGEELDGITYPMTVDEPVNFNDNLYLKVENYDSRWPHGIHLLVTIVGE